MKPAGSAKIGRDSPWGWLQKDRELYAPSHKNRPLWHQKISLQVGWMALVLLLITLSAHAAKSEAQFVWHPIAVSKEAQSPPLMKNGFITKYQDQMDNVTETLSICYAVYDLSSRWEVFMKGGQWVGSAARWKTLLDFGCLLEICWFLSLQINTLQIFEVIYVLLAFTLLGKCFFYW